MAGPGPARLDSHGVDVNQYENNTRGPMKEQLRKVSVVGLLLALGAFSVSAHDHDGERFRAKLAGINEVPLVSTGATGEFEARIEADGSLWYKLSYEGLEGGSTLFAHIHLGQTKVSGAVMTFLCGGGTKPTACPNPSGTVEGVIMATDIQAIVSQQIPAGGGPTNSFAVRSGNAYANVHTTASPAGEIRGQIKVDRPGNGDNKHDR